MDIIKGNISNLTSLWGTSTKPFHTYFETDNSGYCYINNAQWPNRIWMRQNPVESSLSEIITVIKDCPEDLTFSYFDKDQKEDVALITQTGFKEKWIQHGMSLKLQSHFETPSRLSFRKVRHGEEIKAWCSAFHAAFGYKISELTVEKSLKSISYFSVFYEEQLVGTLILHQTGEIAGIHSLGIIPQMRGKGFAREAMHYALNLSIKLNAKVVTLQASEMAKSMYEKLGFSTQFIMRNYQFIS